MRYRRPRLSIMCIVVIAGLSHGCSDEVDSVEPDISNSEANSGSNSSANGATNNLATNNATTPNASAANSGMNNSNNGSVANSMSAGFLSDRYPDDVGLADDPAVLFFDDFEAGWPFDDLAQDQYISSSTRYTWEPRVDRVYWRFYARFPNVAPTGRPGTLPS